MAMRVPVIRSPRTQPGAALEGYAQGGGPTDLTPLIEPLQRFKADLDQAKKDTEAFDLQRRFIAETNELMADFDRRKTEAPLGAEGFTDTIVSDYEQRHTKMLDDYWAQGYSRDVLEDFSLRLSTLRQSFGEQALGFQAQSTRRLAVKNVGDIATGLSQYATSVPDGYSSAEQDLRSSIDMLPIDSQTKADLFDSNIGIVRQGAMRGMALQQPEKVIELLDPNGFTAPINSITAQGGSAYQNITGWQGVATNVAERLGLDAAEVAAVMSFETGGTFDPDKMGGDNGNYMGLIQFGAEERRTYGITTESTPEEWTEAITKFMQDRGFKKGMGIEDFYSTILTGGPGRYDRTDSNGTSVRNAIPRILRDHKPKAEQWLSQGRSTIETIDPGPSTSPEAPDPSTLVPETEETKQTVEQPIVTGNALLDSLNGPERVQILAWARETQNRATAGLKASMDIAINNAVASVTTGEYSGPMLTEEEVLKVYGPIEGPQKWAAFEGSLQTGQVVQRIKTLNPQEIERELASLEPDPASESYAVEVGQFQAAQRAAASVMEQRAKDPAAYAFSVFPDITTRINSNDADTRRRGYAELERAYERMGIPENRRLALTQETIDQLSRQYENQGAAGKLAIIDSSIAEMGNMAGRTLGHIGGKQIAQDLAVASLLTRAPNGRTKLLDVLRGKDLIKEDPARKPSDAAMNQAFLGEMGPTLNNLGPDMSRALNEAAAALYVQRGGLTGKDAGGRDRFDVELYREAFRDAVGGQAGNPNTGILDNTGGKVKDLTLLPPGVTAGQFTNWVESVTLERFTRLTNGEAPRDRSGRPLSMQAIADQGVFVLRAPGVYGIKLQSDGGWVLDSRGQRLTVNLRNMRAPR